MFAPMQDDESSFDIEARRAERTIRIALDRLRQIVGIASHLELRADLCLSSNLLKTAAKLDILLAEFQKLLLEIEDLGAEVDNELLQIKVLDFLRKLSKLLDCGESKFDIAHCGASCSLAMLWPSETQRIACRDKLQSTDLEMRAQQAGFFLIQGCSGVSISIPPVPDVLAPHFRI